MLRIDTDGFSGSIWISMARRQCTYAWSSGRNPF